MGWGMLSMVLGPYLWQDRSNYSAETEVPVLVYGGAYTVSVLAG